MAAINNLNIIIVIGTVIVDSQVNQNVYALRAKTPGGGATIAEGAVGVLAFFNQLYGYIAADMSTNCDFRILDVRNLTQNTLLGVYPWDTSGWAGRSAADPLMTTVSPCVTMTTNSPRTRGRKFLMGYVEGDTTAFRLGTNQMNRLGQFATKLLVRANVPGSGANMEYVVLRSTDLGPSAEDPSGWQVSNIPGTQVRRKPGRGV